MKLSQRISAFAHLGDHIRNLAQDELETISAKAANNNAWFTSESVAMALKGISLLLELTRLQSWAGSLSTEPPNPKTVGIVMAGNIPLVGFHDYLCVLIAGHHARIKLSSQDPVLVEYLHNALVAIEPEFENTAVFADRLNQVEAVIATGSDNTARYFEFYFRHIPRIIRKNRSSVAIVVGEESVEELTRLGVDVFSYFGLGCRNVSKLYVPTGYEFSDLFKAWGPYAGVANHHKYANNYDYQKSILLLNQEKFLDNGFVMINESASFVSPISRVFFEAYSDQGDLHQKLKEQEQKIQCIVSAKGWFPGSQPFGKAQFPELDNYADNVNTLEFLRGMK